MTWREFENAEEQILREAPATRRKLFEVKLRIARERLASGDEIAPEVDALLQDVARASGRSTRGTAV